VHRDTIDVNGYNPVSESFTNQGLNANLYRFLEAIWHNDPDVTLPTAPPQTRSQTTITQLK
jgi:hypothetical protein